MEIGKEVCIKRGRAYGQMSYKYQRGVVCGIYKHHISVKFEYANGNSYKESFFKYELIERGELSKDAYIY